MKVLLLNFASDGHSGSQFLQQERADICDALTPRSRQLHFALHYESKASGPDMLKRLDQYEFDLELLLLCGKDAGEEFLENGEAEAALAAQLRNCRRLHLVVLSGGGTRRLAAVLAEAGVPVVLSTGAETGEAAATRFSTAFFQAMSTEDKSIREACATAIQATLEATGLKLEMDMVEGEAAGFGQAPDAPFQGIYCRKDADLDWTLPKTGTRLLNKVPGIRMDEATGFTGQLLCTTLSLLSHNQVLSSPGGSGKTTQAKLYVHSIGREYDHIAWLDAHNSLCMAIACDQELQQSMDTFIAPDENAIQFGVRMLEAIAKLPGHKLLVIDNADRHQDLYEELLKEDDHFRVLLCSRQPFGDFDHMEVYPLSPEDAEELFRRHCRQPLPASEVSALLEKIGYHPQLVKLFACILEDHPAGESLETLFQTLDDNQSEAPVFDYGEEEYHSFPEEAVLFRHLLTALDYSGIADRPGFSQLLSQLSALPSAVEGHQLRDLMDWFGIKKKRAIFAAQLQELCRLGWLEQPQPGAFDMHPLIREAVLQHCPLELDDLRPLWQALEPRLFGEGLAWGEKFPWAAFGQSVLRAGEHLYFQGKDALEHGLGSLFHKMGDYDAARECLEAAATTSERTLGHDHYNTASHYINLSMVLCDMRDYDATAEATQKALAILEENAGPDSPYNAMNHTNLGMVLSWIHDFENARNILQKALHYHKAHFKEEHEARSLICYQLGIALRELGEYEQANAMLQQALQGVEQRLGADHPDAADVCCDLGQALMQMGDCSGARDILQRARKTLTSSLGPTHQKTMVAISHLGMVLHKMGHLKPAVKLLKQVLAHDEQLLGPDHYNTLASCNNLGLALQDMGLFEEARAQFERAALGTAEQLGQTHLRTGQFNFNLGYLHREIGHYAPAKEAFQKAIVAYEFILGPDHPTTLDAYYRLYDVLCQLSDFAGAAVTAEKFAGGNERRFGPDAPQTVNAYYNLGLIYGELRDYEKAIPMLGNAMLAFRAVHGENHELTLTAKATLQEYEKLRQLKGLPWHARLAWPFQQWTSRLRNALMI